MGEKILEIEGITKNYKEFTLKPVSFALEPGKFMSVMGAYGAGKTTLLKILAGQTRPDAGSIKFLGKEIGRDRKEFLEACGIVPAEGGFPGCLSVRKISQTLKGCYKNWQEEYFLELAEQFSLSLKKPLEELSRGAEQKVRILSALAHKPVLLLLDEPLKGLEEDDRELAEKLFQEFAQKSGHGVLLFTEQTETAEKISDSLAFLYKGELVFAEKQEVLKRRYGFLEASDEELERIPRSAWRGIHRTETGGWLLLERAALPEELERALPMEYPTLEIIQQYLTKEAVRQ